MKKIVYAIVALAFVFVSFAKDNTLVIKDSEGNLDLGDREFNIAIVKIPKGIFLMGSSMGFNVGGTGPNSTAAEPDRASDESQHSVSLTKDFYMSKYEVTFAQYDAFCEATKRQKPEDEGWGRGDRPVIYVDWFDAVAYCNWLSEQTGKTWRLPTEAEWEYACRAGLENRPFGIGTGYILDSTKANFYWEYTWSWDGKSNEAVMGSAIKKQILTQAVGSYPPNAWGLYDMHGNVEEWCNDWYGDYPATSFFDPSSEIEIDPSGKTEGTERVVRGGTCGSFPQSSRSAFRTGYSPTYSSSYLGFRIVLVP